MITKRRRKYLEEKFLYSDRDIVGKLTDNQVQAARSLFQEFLDSIQEGIKIHPGDANLRGGY